MSNEKVSESEQEESSEFSRRGVLTTGLTGVAALSIPKIATAQESSPNDGVNLEEALQDSSVTEEDLEDIPKITREIIRETDEYILVKSEADEAESDKVTYIKEYTSGDKQGTIEVLEPSTIATSKGISGSVESIQTASDADWMEYIGRFDRFRETVFESCVDDDYGYHGWRGASVELTLPIKHTSTFALTSIIEHILEPLGLPEISTMARFIVSLIGSWAVQQFTMGGVDRDGVGDVKYTQVKAAKKWDADADEGFKAGKIPGVHLA